jgi:hypothetical protein
MQERVELTIVADRLRNLPAIVAMYLKGQCHEIVR